MNPNFAIERNRTGADQRRQLARGAAAGEIHLEKAVLGVQKPGRAGHVPTGGPADRRDAEIIPGDPHRGREATKLALALELRKAAAQLRPSPHRANAGRQHQRGQRKDQDPDQPPHNVRPS